MTPVSQNPQIPEQQPLPQFVTPPPPTPVTQATSNLPRMMVHTQAQDSYNWTNLPTTLHTPLNPDANTTTTTTSSTYTTTTTTVTSSEEKNQEVMQLKNRPPIDILPLEMKFEVFSHLRDEIERETGLVAFGKTSTEQRSAVIDYFHHSKEGIAHGLRIADADADANVKIWNACAKHLRENTNALRETFGISAAVIEGLHKSDKSDKEIAAAASSLLALHLDFRKPVSASLITTLLEAMNNEPVKINAEGIGRERFLAEVLPALAKVNPGCQVVLDASNNQLQAEDLQLLVNFMKKNPCIYRLNLSKNFLCIDDKVCLPVVELFNLNGPLTHLYLKSTDINNETALLIAKALIKHPFLTSVDLQRNPIKTSGMLALIKTVGSLDENGVIHINKLLQAVRLRNFNSYANIDLALIMEAAEVANSLTITGDPDNFYNIKYFNYVVQIAQVDRSLIDYPGMLSRAHEYFNNAANSEKL